MDKDAGEIRIVGLEGRKAFKRITYVPQRGSVDWDFPVNVYDVVCQGRFSHLGLFKRMRPEDRRIVADALQKVEMSEFSRRQIGELSGGQQQRVFLARALAHEGDVYLMDEPFAGVDAATERAIVDVLRQLQKEGKTVLVVHHDLSTVAEYFDQVLLLNKRLISFGDTQDVFTGENLQSTYGGKLAVLEDGKLAVFS
jgi:manganese/zinc/iron transport system ATP- binding protein